MHLSVTAQNIIKPLADISALDKMRPLTRFYQLAFDTMAKKSFLFVVYLDDNNVCLLVGADNAKQDTTILLELMATIEQRYRAVGQLLTLPQADVLSVLADIKESLRHNHPQISEHERPRAHQLFADTIRRAFEVGAHDIHLYCYKADNRAFAAFKVNGEFLSSARKSYTGFNDAIKMLRATYDIHSDKEGGAELDERTDQETTFYYDITLADGRIERTRLRLTKSVSGNGDLIYTVIRLLNNKLKTLAQLGLSDEEETIIRRNIDASEGLIVTSGPTGSGKTTLLNAAFVLFPAGKAAQTIEDPPEFILNRDNIVQNQLRGGDFAQQVETAFRQDIDGILIGEVRSAETLRLVIEFGLSGHFCATTTHANTPMGIIERFISLGALPADLASPSLLRLLMGQRLVATLCLHCRLVIHQSNEQVTNALLSFGLTIGPTPFYQRNQTGCAHCSETGIDGRRLVLELIQVSDDDRAYIRSGDYLAWQQSLKAKGHKTLLDKSIALVNQGLVCPLDIL